MNARQSISKLLIKVGSGGQRSENEIHSAIIFAHRWLIHHPIGAHPFGYIASAALQHASRNAFSNVLNIEALLEEMMKQTNEADRQKYEELRSKFEYYVGEKVNLCFNELNKCRKVLQIKQTESGEKCKQNIAKAVRDILMVTDFFLRYPSQLIAAFALHLCRPEKFPIVRDSSNEWFLECDNKINGHMTYAEHRLRRRDRIHTFESISTRTISTARFTVPCFDRRRFY
jgi:hypothetical protein